MRTSAIILEGPERIGCAQLALVAPQENDVVVEIATSGISTGTEKLLWSGQMPPFPGMGYPLVPGYEAVGQVIEVARGSSMRVGQHVFVPGANCFKDAHGLFGASARHVVTNVDRIVPVDAALGEDAALLALAATARHAIAGLRNDLPDLIVGHGVLGRLLARLTLAAGGPPPVVWEVCDARKEGAEGYQVLSPDDDLRRDYNVIYDASGQIDLINRLIERLAKGGELVLAGFYPGKIGFDFPQAFMKEARLRVSAEWTRDDLWVVRDLVHSGVLSLAGLVTHHAKPSEAATAYRQAFDDPACLKMMIDWKDVA